jgi:uncharacterized membrane protein
MHADALIDVYVADVVRLMPRKQRADVALELRALLKEASQARARGRGDALDADLTLEALRAFGRPEDVAARYLDPWIIIPQAQTRPFAFAAAVGAAVLVALSPLGTEETRAVDTGVAVLAWFGVLVMFFGLTSFLRRRRPEGDPWIPRDRDRANRFGSVALVVIITIGITAYGAPEWVDHWFAPVRLLAWLDFDPVFRASRLPVLFALWACQAILFATLAVRGRWNPVLRRAELTLEIAVVLVLVWFLAMGPVFSRDVANTAAQSAIGVFVLLMLVDIGVKWYRAAGRPEPAGRPGVGTNRA